MKIISVVVARPNFTKIAPFIKAITSYSSQLLTAVAEAKVVTTPDAEPVEASSLIYSFTPVSTPFFRSRI